MSEALPGGYLSAAQVHPSKFSINKAGSEVVGK